MVQIARQLSELSASHILLLLDFLHESVFIMLFQHFSHVLIFFLHMLEVLLARVKVMFVFAAVIAPEAKV